MGKVLSLHAVDVAARAYTLSYNLFSDPNWALLEAFEKETPSGVVHLHWYNHRGKGSWKLITQPYHGGALCKTARCRVVTITPHGGVNETCDISRQRYDEAMATWVNNKNLDQLRRWDVEKALNERRLIDEQIRRLIEDPYGPWDYRETPKRWRSREWGQWMHELDVELNQSEKV